MPGFRRLFQGSQNWLFVLPSIAMLALFALPLAALAERAIREDFLGYALSSSALAALRLSIVTSLLTVLITIILGTPLAYILARRGFALKQVVEMLVDLPVILPPSVAGLSLLIAFGRQGFFGKTLALFNISLPFTTTAVIIAQTFVAAPLYVRSARAGFRAVERQLVEAAHVEGANQWQLFREVMLPLAGRFLLNGAILTWTRALGEFGATILFAGNMEGVTQTMPLAIYLGFERGLGIAVALSMLLVITSIILLAATKRLEKDDHLA